MIGGIRTDEFGIANSYNTTINVTRIGANERNYLFILIYTTKYKFRGRLTTEIGQTI